jgi:hypothetical protein
MAVFRVVASCSTVELYRRFRGAYCLHHQDNDESSTKLHGATTQKTVIFKTRCCFIRILLSIGLCHIKSLK